MSSSHGSADMPSVGDGSQATDHKPIFVIVATSKCGTKLGIGKDGSLPWPMIKPDMDFFRKCTTNGHDQNSQLRRTSTASRVPIKNAVLMGRKTYNSIPEKFRPLKDRTNIILTRSKVHDVSLRVVEELRAKQRRAKSAEQDKQDARPVLGRTVSDNVSLIEDADDPPDSLLVVRDDMGNIPDVIVTNSLHRAIDVDSDQTWCIGGSEVYDLLFKDEQLRGRICLFQTEIEKTDGTNFECDTFLNAELSDKDRWQAIPQQEAESWTGIPLPQGNEDWCTDKSSGCKLRVHAYRAVS